MSKFCSRQKSKRNGEYHGACEHKAGYKALAMLQTNRQFQVLNLWLSPLALVDVSIKKSQP